MLHYLQACVSIEGSCLTFPSRELEDSSAESMFVFIGMEIQGQFVGLKTAGSLEDNLKWEECGVLFWVSL